MWKIYKHFELYTLQNLKKFALLICAEQNRNCFKLIIYSGLLLNGEQDLLEHQTYIFTSPYDIVRYASFSLFYFLVFCILIYNKHSPLIQYSIVMEKVQQILIITSSICSQMRVVTKINVWKHMDGRTDGRINNTNILM